MSRKLEKNFEKSRRKMLREEYELHHPHYTEGHWEDAMLENHSYYDIDILNKANTKTNQGIKYWEERKSKASSWLGKWASQLKIDKLKKKLKHYENKS
jgi:hypothetical protein